MSNELLTIVFEIIIRRTIVEVDDVFEIYTKIDENGETDIGVPSWDTFKRFIKDGVIKYDFEKDNLWYIRPDSHRDVALKDEATFAQAVGLMIRSGRFHLLVTVKKKLATSEANALKVETWLDDQAEVDWLRDHDPVEYRRRYH